MTLSDATRPDPAALYVMYLHPSERDRPGFAEAVLSSVRDHIPPGAALLDRTGLYPRETLAGTVKSVRSVDAVVMVGKPPSDAHSSPVDRRVDLDPVQREIAELAVERGIAVLVRTREGQLARIEQCHRTDRRGGMRLVPPSSDDD
jgi:hypothetical protein